MDNGNKFAGWTLCLVSVLLLAGLGRLDLLVVLLPASVLLSFCITAARRAKENADRPHKKGIA